MDSQETAPKRKREMGAFAGFFVLLGLAILGVTVVSALNVIFGWNLALSVYGSSTPLPTHWEVVLALGVTGALIVGVAIFGSSVAGMFRDAKGRPLKRLGIVVGALALLVVVGRGLQIVALTSTYGSMLAYYCTDVGSVEDVKDELALGPTQEDLDQCIGRTAQWNRADLLPMIVEAGGNFEDATSEPEHRHCVLGADSIGLEYVETAIGLGATPQTCPNSETLIWQRVDRGRDDAQTAAIVAALLAAGWSPTPIPDYSQEPAKAVAVRRGLTQTAAALP